MQDRPTAPELLDSVAEYLFAELRGEVPREQRFKVLVAANICAVVAREISAGDQPDRDDLALFGELLGKDVDDVHAAATELSTPPLMPRMTRDFFTIDYPALVLCLDEPPGHGPFHARPLPSS